MGNRMTRKRRLSGGGCFHRRTPHAQKDSGEHAE
jgi:hypothetical protein